MPISKSIDKAFFKRWNVDMAYILGFLFADGNIVQTNRGAYYFSMYSMDRGLVATMRSCMKATQKLSKRSGSVYRLQVGSKEMVEDLARFGLIANKVRRMQFPTVPQKYFPHFLRGYFDGDGNVWTGEVHRVRTTTTKTIIVAFTSASKLFLSYLHAILKEKGIVGGSLFRPKGKDCGRLSFSKNDSLKIYKLMYNNGAFGDLYLKRKKDVFDKYIRSMRV